MICVHTPFVWDRGMNCGISCETAARIVALHLAVTHDGSPTRFLCYVDVGVDEVLTSCWWYTGHSGQAIRSTTCTNIHEQATRGTWYYITAGCNNSDTADGNWECTWDQGGHGSGASACRRRNRGCSHAVAGMFPEAWHRCNATTNDIPYTGGLAQHCMSGMHPVQCHDFGAHWRGHKACGLAIRGNAKSAGGETRNLHIQVHYWIKFISIQICCYVRDAEEVSFHMHVVWR